MFSENNQRKCLETVSSTNRCRKCLATGNPPVIPVHRSSTPSFQVMMGTKHHRFSLHHQDKPAGKDGGGAVAAGGI